MAADLLEVDLHRVVVGDRLRACVFDAVGLLARFDHLDRERLDGGRVPLYLFEQIDVGRGVQPADLRHFVYLVQQHRLVARGDRDDVVHRQVAQHAPFDLDFFGVGLPFHLGAGLDLHLVQHARALEHADRIGGQIAVEDQRRRGFAVEPPAGRFGFPLVGIAVAVEVDRLALANELFELLVDRLLLFHAVLDVSVDGLLEAGELLDLVEMDIRDVLTQNDFPGDEVPVIRGSAKVALDCTSTDPNAPEYACIKELMDAVDEYIPAPERDENKPFLMPVEDTMTITGRGTVATGRVERGVVKVNDTVEITGLTEEPKSTVVTGLEMFRKTLDEAVAGYNIGALLRGINRTDIERGQVLCKPGSIHPHTKFTGQVYVLKKEEGGRHTPFVSNYRPQFFFRTTDVTGVITLPADKEMCMPGDNVVMDVELITPIAIEEGLRFAIREGGRTVGSGVVTKING